MELDLQSLFGLHVHICTHIRDALLVIQSRRHLFVTPWFVLFQSLSGLLGFTLAGRPVLQPYAGVNYELSISPIQGLWSRLQDMFAIVRGAINFIYIFNYLLLYVYRWTAHGIYSTWISKIEDISYALCSDAGLIRLCNSYWKMYFVFIFDMFYKC
jgi:hypothetical protein